MKKAIDLFAGLGGNTEGARSAGVETVWAANHWRIATDTHARNHPYAVHACQDLQQADWRHVPLGFDLLMASPACQGHSPARGKDRPHHDATRSTAWAVVSAAEYHRPPFVMVENVPAFANWALYSAWCGAMTALGYALSPIILDAANCGVPQHRKRLFIVGTLSKHPVELRPEVKPARAAATFIDFDDGAWTHIQRPGRSARTLARIQAGRTAHGDRFVMPYYGSGSGLTGRSIDRPIGTITTRARWALVDGNRMRMLTVRECKLGMGFPETYLLPNDDKTAIFMLGNANPPPMAHTVIDALKRAA